MFFIFLFIINEKSSETFRIINFPKFLRKKLKLSNNKNVQKILSDFRHPCESVQLLIESGTNEEIKSLNGLWEEINGSN